MWQVRPPPASGVLLSPAFVAVTAVRHTQKLTGVLRAEGRIFLEACEDEVVELARDGHLGSL
jgi:hypothetical protein